METEATKTNALQTVDRLFKAGAHFGYSKSRRHPSVKKYVFGMKNRVQIIDLEKTTSLLETARNFVKELGREGKKILFVGNKDEAQSIVKGAAESIGMPYVAERWLGGTLTNFTEILKRTARLTKLKAQRESGELNVYTKKERSLIEKEIEKLERFFSGIVLMKELPSALFVVDSRAEEIAVSEAGKVGIPVVSISNLDCDIDHLDYPIVGNDASPSSISFFTESIAEAYKEGVAERKNLKESEDAKRAEEKAKEKTEGAQESPQGAEL